jgi:hypothetical protein
MKQSIRDRELPAFALAFVGVVGLAFNIWFAELNRAGWGLDFNQFYSAGRLAGTGHIYDWDALRKLESENGIPMPTGRLPVVLFGHKILSNLPYAEAQYVWLAASIAALLVFAMAWPGTQRLLMMVALAWSMPLTLVLLYGQDVPFWLTFFAARSVPDGAKETLDRGDRILALYLQISSGIGDSDHVGGAETLEDADCRSHRFLDVDCDLLFDRRTPMAA